MCELKKVIMQRDCLSDNEANELIIEAKQRVLEGENPENILYADFGLEPDYFLDLMPY